MGLLDSATPNQLTASLVFPELAEVVKDLASMLTEAATADVILTRTKDIPVSNSVQAMAASVASDKAITLALGALSLVLAVLLLKEVSLITSDSSTKTLMLLKGKIASVLTLASMAVSRIALTKALPVLADPLVATTKLSVASMASKTRVASATALAMEELARGTARVRRDLTSSSVNSRRHTRARKEAVPAADTVRDNSTRSRRPINLSSSSIR